MIRGQIQARPQLLASCNIRRTKLRICLDNFGNYLARPKHQEPCKGISTDWWMDVVALHISRCAKILVFTLSDSYPPFSLALNHHHQEGNQYLWHPHRRWLWYDHDWPHVPHTAILMLENKFYCILMADAKSPPFTTPIPCLLRPPPPSAFCRSSWLKAELPRQRMLV